MARTIIPNGGHQGAVPPPGVEKTEQENVDWYEGSKETLIAAGLVRPDQFPPEGKMGISYYSGVASSRRGRIDENYLRVEYLLGTKAWRVRVGVPQSEQVERRAAMHARYEARRATEKAQESAKEKIGHDVRRAALGGFCTLMAMIHTPAQYRQKMVKQLREQVRLVRNNDVLVNDNHGFSMGESVAEALDELLDQMIELVADAEVHFDAPRHKAINTKAMAAVQHHPLYRDEIARHAKENCADEEDDE